MTMSQVKLFELCGQFTFCEHEKAAGGAENNRKSLRTSSANALQAQHGISLPIEMQNVAQLICQSQVEEMAQETKFTKEEVKFLYRAFKQECPNGIIDEDTFKEVYAKIFPLGDATKYAHLVFTAIDKEKTGGITFGDFMDFLSIISKGSPKEKILWSFHFYDVNRDGQISKEEMVKVILGIMIHELQHMIV